MDKELIKKLSKAGVSAEVILALMLDEEEKPQPEQPKPEPTPQPEPKPEPAPQPAAVGNDAILAAIERLTGAVQASNMRSMDGGQPVRETADDILASLIAPKK